MLALDSRLHRNDLPWQAENLGGSRSALR